MTMNDDAVITDLKRFITATVRQEIAGLRAEMNAGFAKVDQRFDDQDAKLTTIADAHAEVLEDHDQRLAKLEARTA